MEKACKYKCGLCASARARLLCGTCGSVRYCSPEHQRLHWKEAHKYECDALSHFEADCVTLCLSEDEPSDEADLLDAPLTIAVLDDQTDAELGLRSSDSGLFRQECPATSPSTTSLTPAEAGESNGAGETPVSRLDMFPDLQALELQGFPPDWLEAVASTVVVDLNKYGVCVIDSFLGHQRANQVRQEVLSLDAQGGFRAGQLVAGNHVQGQTRWHIRGDRVRWLSGNEPFAPHVGQLVKVVDTLVIKSNRHPLAGELAEHNVSLRTRAMVACYPGQGAQYVKHVDNPNGDGRLITAIYYVNKDWTEQDGGILEMYLKDRILPIKPLFDRMVFFWSDRRTPHAVRPSNLTRYAITVWYLDEKERDLFMAKVRSLCSAAS